MEATHIRSKNLNEPLSIDIHSNNPAQFLGNPEDFETLSSDEDGHSRHTTRHGRRNEYKMYSRPSHKDQLSPDTKEELRLRVNSRERQRMHDINGALDALRQVMPYHNGPSVKKISKMSTLLLARNYIVLLTRTLEELRRLVAISYGNNGSLPSGLMTGIPTPSAVPESRPYPVVPGVPIPTPHSGLLTPGSPAELHLRSALLQQHHQHHHRSPFNVPLAELTHSRTSPNQENSTTIRSPTALASQVAEVSTTSRQSLSPANETVTDSQVKAQVKPSSKTKGHGSSCFCIQCLTTKH